MTELDQLQALTKALVVEAGEKLKSLSASTSKRGHFLARLPKEIKSEADAILDHLIMRRLRPLGMAILSEESGYIEGNHPDHLWFIVDPLDGTFNFVRGMSPSAVSIALWQGGTPVFGAVYDLSTDYVYSGGPSVGAHCNGAPIAVSTTNQAATASIHTGFPARLDTESKRTEAEFWRMVKPFGKVRMIGSAAMSLVNVARGITDVYAERNIMLWDVAAGLAIVQGAGGEIEVRPQALDWSCVAVATNGKISINV
jgi:myo-inositol-1(or 4)-monophosphatase